MKAKDLPETFKQMYDIEYIEALEQYYINRKSSTGIAISKDSEFEEDKMDYSLRLKDVSLILSKDKNHIAVIIR